MSQISSPYAKQNAVWEAPHCFCDPPVGGNLSLENHGPASHARPVFPLLAHHPGCPGARMASRRQRGLVGRVRDTSEARSAFRHGSSLISCVAVGTSALEILWPRGTRWGGCEASAGASVEHMEGSQPGLFLHTRGARAQQSPPAAVGPWGPQSSRRGGAPSSVASIWSSSCRGSWGGRVSSEFCRGKGF